MKNRELAILSELAAQSDAAAIQRGKAPIEPFAVATSLDSVLQARGLFSVAATVTDEEEDDE
jgi:hypothetical protein